MRVANVQDGHLELSEIKTIEATDEEIQRYNLMYGDVLLTEGGDPDKLGRGAVWKDEIANCIFQNHIFRVRVDETRLNPTFLSFLTGSNYGKRYFLKSAKQTTGIASINSTQLKNFPAIVPPIALQTQFSGIVDKIELLKVQYQASLQELNNLYESLSQRAFKGELDLSKVEIENFHTSWTNEKPITKLASDSNINNILEGLPEKYSSKEDFLLLYESFLKEHFIKRAFTQAIAKRRFNKIYSSQGLNFDYEIFKTVVFKALKEKDPFLCQSFNKKRKRLELEVIK
jgi:type I restriction enzyme S subunit